MSDRGEWGGVWASVRPWIKRARSCAPLAAVIALVIAYVVYVCYRQYWMLYALHFPDFDMSHYHQKVWLLSHFKEPFITVRGLNTFGAHASFIDLVFVPFYWITSTPLTLLWGQTVVLGFAGYMVFLIGRRRLQSAWMGVFLTAIFLLYPALHYLNFENYHPVSFAVPFFLMFWYGFEINNRKLTLIAALLLISVRQDMSLVLAGTAVYLWVFRKWKPGKYYAGLGVVCFLVLILVVMPTLNKTPSSEYGDRVSSPFPDWLRGKITMMEYERKSHSDENAKYVKDLFYPLGMLPLVKPLPVLLNPLLYFNLTTSWPYAHRIEYHYTSTIIGSIFVSLIEAIAFCLALVRRRRSGRFLVLATVQGVLVVCTVLTNKIDHQHFRFRNIVKPGPKPNAAVVADIFKVKARLRDKALSVHHSYLPFFADRQVCYLWPNPLKVSYYGAGKYLRVDKQPEYVVLPRDGISFDNRALLNEHGYEETFRAKTLVVYRGAGTPARAWDSEAAARVGATGGALAGGNGLSSTGDVQLASELLARSITAGVTGRVIYVDGCYGVTPSGLDILNRNGNKVNLYRQGFQFNRDRLFQSGLLIMQYAVGRPEPTEAEYEIIRRYVANGGRLLLMCPAWVWPAYDKKPLHQLPYRRIAEQFELEMEAGYVNAPLTIEHADFGVEGADELLRGAFSAIDYQPRSGAFPIVVGNSGNAGSVAAQKGNARIIVWGQNNLLSSEAAGRPGAVEFVGKAVNWLLAPPVGGGVDGTAEDRPFGEDNEGQTHDAPLKARSM